MQDLINSYLNGNISYVREQLRNSCSFSMGELLDYFVNHTGYYPTTDEIVLFVKRLEA